MKKQLSTKKRTLNHLYISIGLFALIVALFLLIKPTNQTHSENEKEPNDRLQKENFHPNSLSTKELAKYKKWKADLAASGYRFPNQINTNKPNLKSATAASSTSNSYANSKITGVWKRKNFTNPAENYAGTGPNRNGYRVVGSEYDPVNDVFYAISESGSLYKTSKSANQPWEALNTKTYFINSALSSVNLSDGSYRMLMQSDNGPMMYSDDEGRTWLNANGALFENDWNYNTMVTNIRNGKRITAFGSKYVNGNAYYRVYFSTDYGLNYTESSINHWSHSQYQTKVIKANNSNALLAFVRDISTKKVHIYIMTQWDDDFKWQRGTTQLFDDLTDVKATYANNKIHIYINDGVEKIYYSNDKGANWSLVNSSSTERAIAEVHPTNPDIVYKGYTDLHISTNKGATWTKYNHYIGTHYFWDVMHMQFYKKADGTDIAFVGTDFGCYYSENASDKNSWQTLNYASPIMLCYDAVYSEKNNVGYTAKQDRGTQGYVDNQDNYNYDVTEITTTDVLRVTLAKDESSVWYWKYSGIIGRSDVLSTAKPSRNTSKDYYGSWWSSTMIASPNKNEDAVYIAASKKLQKFTYDGSQISRTYHHYQFPSDIVSFGYSEINTDRWYTCTKNGQFYYSTDGGNTFNASSYNGSWPQQQDSYSRSRQVIKACPKDENIVYFAGIGNYFLISKDGGKTFTSHTRGLDVGRFRDFDISDNGKFIFAACGWSGPWVYSVDDDYWYSMVNNNTDFADYTTVQYINSKSLVRFSTYGDGISDLIIDQDLSAPFNIALNKTAYSVSDWNSNNDKSFSNDGDNSTKWASAISDDSKWIFYDLGDTYSIESVNINWSNSYGIDYKIQVWLNSRWTTIKTVNNNNSLTNKITGLNSEARYIRLYCSEGIYRHISLYEFEVYGYSLKSAKISDQAATPPFSTTLKVYPNPAVDKFIIKSPSDSEAKVFIYNTKGELKYKNAFYNELQISTNELSGSGVFVIKLQTEGRIYNSKVIIK